MLRDSWWNTLVVNYNMSPNSFVCEPCMLEYLNLKELTMEHLLHCPWNCQHPNFKWKEDHGR